jgi:hypothetical protein
MSLQDSALTLRPPTFRPLITSPNVVTTEGSDPKTFRPCSTKTQKWTGPKVVCLPEIVTLRPQKVGHSVTVEHSIPLVFWPPLSVILRLRALDILLSLFPQLKQSSMHYE